MLSLGANAEYGNVAGAVFNIVTRQGSQPVPRRHEHLLSAPEPDRAQHRRQTQDGGRPTTAPASSTPPRSSAGRSSRTSCGSSARSSTSRTASRSPARPAEFPAKSNAKRYFCKLNYSLNQNHRIQFQTHDDFYEIPERASADKAPSSIGAQQRPQPVARRALHGRDQSDDGGRSALLGLLRHRRHPAPERRTARSRVASRTSTPATSPAASTTGTTASRSRPRSPARSPSTPTTSSARSTTSRWACSTTAAAASR